MRGECDPDVGHVRFLKQAREHKIEMAAGYQSSDGKTRSCARRMWMTG